MEDRESLRKLGTKPIHDPRTAPGSGTPGGKPIEKTYAPLILIAALFTIACDMEETYVPPGQIEAVHIYTLEYYLYKKGLGSGEVVGSRACYT